MIVRTLLIGISFLLGASSVQGFEQSGSARYLLPAAVTEAGSTAVELTEQAENAGRGTSFAIPGIGALGVLPKLDFGLELLYGESSGRSNDPIVELPSNEDGLRIKGTLKHRF